MYETGSVQMVMHNTLINCMYSPKNTEDNVGFVAGIMYMDMCL